MKPFKKIMREEGSFPILAIILIGMLIFTGLAYMKWGADESWQVKYKKAQMQAYYAAHAGIMDVGYHDLFTLKPGIIPPEPVSLGGCNVTNSDNKVVTTVTNVIRKPNINELGTAFADYNFVDYTAYGRVDIKGYKGDYYSVTDSVTVKVKLLGLANFLYLTDIEMTIFGEVIKFWHEDTLDGWVHSNDTIAIMENPVFYHKVTTTAPVFWIGPSYAPVFVNYDPIFEYREIYLPNVATEIRNAAAAGGTFFTSQNGQLASRLVFKGRQGWDLYQWGFGMPFDSTLSPVASGSVPTWQAIFVDGYLELMGIVAGQVTVGAKGHPDPSPMFYGYHCIRLMDDVRYWFANPYNGDFDDTTDAFQDILGIVSEGHIMIGNTWENGRENGVGVEPWNWNRHSIVITAAMVALGESFSFEDQNEPPPTPTIWEFYTGNYYCPDPPIGPSSDERGDIYLHGANTQKRRGYVHRSNHNGTGYGKQYKFDHRLNRMAPPYFLEATDSEGHAHFEIIKWGN